MNLPSLNQLKRPIQVTIGTNPPYLSKLPNGTMLAKQSVKPQLKGKWSIIPECHRPANLAALSMKRHSTATLVKHNYTPGPGYTKVPGVEVALLFVPLPSPAYKPYTPKLSVVALDCEMVGVNNGESEVARISAVDYLSGNVLIDTMILPTQAVVDWRTKFSGITKQALTSAVAEGRALKGWPAARNELWKHIDDRTILVGHALHHDLQALRMQHWQIVDSAILAQDAVGVKPQWGLKTLCSQLLQIDVQNNGNNGHDSVEDALAAREVVLWCIAHPEELRVWGKERKSEYQKKEQDRKTRAKDRAQKKKTASTYSRPRCNASDEED